MLSAHRCDARNPVACVPEPRRALGVSAQVYEVASKILEQPSLGVRAMAMAEALGIEA